MSETTKRLLIEFTKAHLDENNQPKNPILTRQSRPKSLVASSLHEAIKDLLQVLWTMDYLEVYITKIVNF